MVKAETPVPQESAELRRFSHSLVDCYLDCPKKAYYRYIDKRPSPMGSALIKGRAMDEAANFDLEMFMESGEHVKMSDLLDMAERAYAQAVDDAGGESEVDWGDDPEDLVFDSTIRLTKTWRRELAPSIIPTAVQVEYHRPLPSGRDFIGFVDWEGSVNGSDLAEPVIGDNKTGKRKMGRQDAPKSLQPYAYAYLRGDPTTFVFARSIDTGKSVSSEFVWTERSKGDIAWYAQLLTEVERAFDAGIWPTNPKSFLCNERWCPYFAVCQPHRTTHTA